MASAKPRTDSEGRQLAARSDATLSAFGPEFARLMAGIDWRVSRSFGLGPVVEGSIGQYTSFAGVRAVVRRVR